MRSNGPPDQRAGEARSSHRPAHRASSHPSASSRVLVVSSEATWRRALARALMDEHDVLTAEDESVGLALLANAPVEVIVAEVGAARDGDDLVRAFQAAAPGVDVVLLGGEALESEAHPPTQAFHFVSRAFTTPKHVAWSVARACERRRMRERIQRLERRIEHQENAGEIIGTSRVMQDVFDLAHGAAVASSPVLIVGESGTGKEMIARAMHRLGRRAAGPFLSIDCAALPVDQVQQEIFGEPGSSRSGRSLVHAAVGGTLFLADVGALPAACQAQLVQLVQHGGPDISEDAVRVDDVRLIVTSLVELKAKVDEGVVRRDLYYHLNALVIRVPPLRRRKEDIPLLAYHFLHRHAQRLGRNMQRISPEALRLLRDHRWAGNVRELDHAIERAVAMARSEVVLPADLAFLRDEQTTAVLLHTDEEPRDTAFDPALFDLPYPEAKKRAVTTFDRMYTKTMLDRAGGNVSEAARQAGLDRSNFRRVMKKTGRE